MKTKELRSRKAGELLATLNKLMAESGKVRMEMSVGKIKNNQKLRAMRKDMARIKTILHEQKIIERESENEG